MALFLGTIGNDYLIGTRDDDVFIAGVDNDNLFGRSGDDLFIFYPNAATIYAYGGKGDDTVGMVYRDDYKVTEFDNGFIIHGDDFTLVARNIENLEWL